MNSLELKIAAPTFLAGDEAVDVSRITGIPYFFGRTETHGRRHPMIDLMQLSDGDRVRITWALVAAYAYLESIGYDRADLESSRNLSYWEGTWN